MMTDVDSRIKLLGTQLVEKAPYIRTLLRHDPERLQRVCDSDYWSAAKPLAALQHEICGFEHNSLEDFNSYLRRVRGDELCRLAKRELVDRDFANVGLELSNLADSCMEASLQFHYDQLVGRYGEPTLETESSAPHIAAMALGKLGGQELNFCSDIDLIFVYPTDQGQAGSLSLHEFFSKLVAEACRSLSDVTETDLVFRVDHGLRPEGRSGPLTNSFDAIERYYEVWGRFWERLAWTKARPCAGNVTLGRSVAESLQPFIYSNQHDIVSEICHLQEKVIAENDRRVSVDGGINLKVGRGGIRQIEFFLQSLQLIHGRKNKDIRQGSTRKTISALLSHGIISDHDARYLSDAYDWLRHAEHLLQLQSGRQTQRLPDDAEERRAFYEKLGDTDKTRQAHGERVINIFASLADNGDTHDNPAVRKLISTDLPRSGIESSLAELDFADPVSTTSFLIEARKAPGSPFHLEASAQRAALSENMLCEAMLSPNPDQSLQWFCRLAVRPKQWPTIERLFRTAPATLRLAANVFGSSEYLARRCFESVALLDSLTAPALLPTTAVFKPVSLDSYEEDFWNTLAALKHEETMRLGIADISGGIDPEKICYRLSDLADFILNQALAFVREGMGRQYGRLLASASKDAEICILGLGKLGGQELGYEGDLDIVFVHNAETTESDRLDVNTYVTRVAQRLISGLQTLHARGRIYEIDTRLRPSGSSGTLVSALSGWQQYHSEKSELWEKQALTKLRFVAGDVELGESALESAAKAAYTSRSADELRDYIRDMRDRIEKERGNTKLLDIKFNAGGIIDIEFLCQYLQLALGTDNMSLRHPNTSKVLDRLSKLDQLNFDTLELKTNYWFLRHAELRIRLSTASDQTLVSGHPALLKTLMPIFDVTRDQDVIPTLEAKMKRVRQCFDQVFGPM